LNRSQRRRGEIAGQHTVEMFVQLQGRSRSSLSLLVESSLQEQNGETFNRLHRPWAP